VLTSSAWAVIVDAEVTAGNVGACFVWFTVVALTSAFINVLTLVVSETEPNFAVTFANTFGDIWLASGSNDAKTRVVGTGTNSKRIWDGIAVVAAWSIDACFVDGTLVVSKVLVKFTLVNVGTDHSITTKNDWRQDVTVVTSADTLHLVSRKSASSVNTTWVLAVAQVERVSCVGTGGIKANLFNTEIAITEGTSRMTVNAITALSQMRINSRVCLRVSLSVSLGTCAAEFG
jgi:hypothetical protein